MGRRIARLGGRLIAVALLMAVAIGVAFGVDQWIHRDRVGRNVSVAGFEVSDGTTEDIAR